MFPMPKLPSWAIPAAIGVFVILAALTVAYCAGGKGEKLDRARDTIETQKDIGTANEKAGDLRVEDKARIVREQQELTNAIEDAQGPDDLRRRRGCVILRQQLGPDGRLPAACGPEGR